MKIKNILFNILVIVTVISVAFVGFNLITGAKGYVVTSPSMEDTLSEGDIVFVKAVTFEELKVGDVVTVKSFDGKSFFTHRVVEINTQDRTISTRGDANAVEDPMPTEADRIVGKMWYSVPLLGHVSLFLNVRLSSGTQLLLDIAIAAVLILANIVLPKILKKKKQKRGDSDESC